MATIDIKVKSYDELQFEVMTLTTNSYLKDLKIKELEDRIQKAIEYIEEYKVYNKGFEKYDICDLDIKNILEILKGEEDIWLLKY